MDQETHFMKEVEPPEIVTMVKHSTITRTIKFEDRLSDDHTIIIRFPRFHFNDKKFELQSKIDRSTQKGLASYTMEIIVNFQEKTYSSNIDLKDFQPQEVNENEGRKLELTSPITGKFNYKPSNKIKANNINWIKSNSKQLVWLFLLYSCEEEMDLRDSDSEGSNHDWDWLPDEPEYEEEQAENQFEDTNNEIQNQNENQDQSETQHNEKNNETQSQNENQDEPTKIIHNQHNQTEEKEPQETSEPSETKFNQQTNNSASKTTSSQNSITSDAESQTELSISETQATPFHPETEQQQIYSNQQVVPPRGFEEKSNELSMNHNPNIFHSFRKWIIPHDIFQHSSINTISSFKPMIIVNKVENYKMIMRCKLIHSDPVHLLVNTEISQGHNQINNQFTFNINEWNPKLFNKHLILHSPPFQLYLDYTSLRSPIENIQENLRAHKHQLLSFLLSRKSSYQPNSNRTTWRKKESTQPYHENPSTISNQSITNQPTHKESISTGSQNFESQSKQDPKYQHEPNSPKISLTHQDHDEISESDSPIQTHRSEYQEWPSVPTLNQPNVSENTSIHTPELFTQNQTNENNQPNNPQPNHPDQQPFQLPNSTQQWYRNQQSNNSQFNSQQRTRPPQSRNGSHYPNGPYPQSQVHHFVPVQHLLMHLVRWCMTILLGMWRPPPPQFFVPQPMF